jgi:hypothetical protein
MKQFTLVIQNDKMTYTRKVTAADYFEAATQLWRGLLPDAEPGKVIMVIDDEAKTVVWSQRVAEML